MKLTKINLSELANTDLNEREMCRLLGGGTPGCCQCGCHGSSTTSSNDSANDADGYTSDPDATTPCDEEEATPGPTVPPPPPIPPIPLDVPCHKY
jgi:natural product precursor